MSTWPIAVEEKVIVLPFTGKDPETAAPPAVIAEADSIPKTCSPEADVLTSITKDKVLVVPAGIV